MTYVCYQGNDRDCGFASLRMLMANKAHNKSYLYLEKPQKKKDYTFYDLIRHARRYGFVLSSYQMPVDDVKEIPNSTIVMLKKNHLVYLKRVGRKKVYYVDPNTGRETISISEFEKIWTGLLIECVNTQYVLDIKRKKERMTPTWMSYLHVGLILTVFAFLMTGFYLLKDDSSIILTMVFLLLFGLAQLVENWYIIKELKVFDDKFIPKFFSRKRNHNYKQYSFYLEFKSKYFITGKVLASNLILITAFSILLCMNDFRNLFVFIILLLLKMLDNLLFNRSERNNERQIENIEAVAFASEPMVVKNLTRANTLANKTALTSSLKKIVYLFICLCLAVGMMLFSNLTSTNFVITHLGLYFLMSEAFDGVIKYFSNFRDRKIKEARFFEECDL